DEPAGGIRRDRVSPLDTGGARDGGQELRLLDVSDVVDEVPAASRSVKLVLVRRGVVTEIEVVVSKPPQHRGREAVWNRYLADLPLSGVTTGDDLVEVVDVGVRGDGGRDQVRVSVGVPVGEDHMKAAGRVWRPDPPRDPDLARVGQRGHISDDGPEIGV